MRPFCSGEALIQCRCPWVQICISFSILSNWPTYHLFHARIFLLFLVNCNWYLRGRFLVWSFLKSFFCDQFSLCEGSPGELCLMKWRPSSPTFTLMMPSATKSGGQRRACLRTLSSSVDLDDIFLCRVDPRYASNGGCPLDIAKEQQNWKNLPENALIYTFCNVHETKLGYQWMMTSVQVCHLWLFVLIFAQPT